MGLIHKKQSPLLKKIRHPKHNYALKEENVNALALKVRTPRAQEIARLLQPLKAELAKYNNGFGKGIIINRIKERYSLLK